MGNRIGIDISGTLIRVSVVCLPRDPDEFLASIPSLGIYEALEKTKQEQLLNNQQQEQLILIHNNIKDGGKAVVDQSSSSSSSTQQQTGGASSHSHNDLQQQQEPQSRNCTAENCSRNDSTDSDAAAIHSTDDQQSINQHAEEERRSSSSLSSLLREDPSLDYLFHPYSDSNLLLLDDHHEHHQDHQQQQSHHHHDSPCQYRHFLHNYNTPEEIGIKNFLDSPAPLWGPPRTFCFNLYGPYPGKAFCFVIDLNHAEVVLREALPYLQGSHLQLTGSGATYLRDLIAEKFPSVDLHLQFHREISCILEALDFLVCQVPGACFRYARTHRALNSVLPDDKNYTAVPLEKDDRDNFYPFLLVNLKAGVSFHLVTAPNESERVGGSTIGGATFMGLIRLLCRSISSPLDAFLLAQSGDNSTTDMLVGDIYGGDYPAIGLKGTTIASTFGKLQGNCPKTLKPANLCAKRWVKQAHRRRRRKSGDKASGPVCSSTPLSRAASEDTPPKTDSAASRLLSAKSECQGTAEDSSDQNNGHAHAPSPISAPESRKMSSWSSSSLETDRTPSSVSSATATPHFGNNTQPHDRSSAFFPPTRRCTATPVPHAVSSQPPVVTPLRSHPFPSSRSHASPTIPTVSETPPVILNCGDPLCCCCGLQRWAQCEATEASAAAAVGILVESEGRLLEDTSELDQLLGKTDGSSGAAAAATPCSLAASLHSQFRTDVALDPTKSVVDEETAANRRRASSVDQATREPTEADVARSILTMMSFNVAQQAYLNSVIHNCSRIVLVGYYLEMPGYLSSIQHCIDFWSGGKCKINFVRLATNLGALGASLRTRRRSSGAYLQDCISDDRTPSPHRMMYHLQQEISKRNLTSTV